MLNYTDPGFSKVFSRCELANELKYKHNISEDQLATWVCIARYESQYNTSAVGHTNEDRSGDHGLFQVSDIYWCSPPGIGLACGISCVQLEDDDITDDVTCIRRIYRAHERQTGNGFSAWAVYEPYCKKDADRFIDDCFTTKTATTTQLPYVQTVSSKNKKNSTLPVMRFLYSELPWWLQTMEKAINFTDENYISNNNTIRPFSFYTQQNKTYYENSVDISITFTQKPFQYTTYSTQSQQVSVTTQKPLWFNTHKSNLYITRKLTPSNILKPVWSSSTSPKPVWSSSSTHKSVWSSSSTPKPVWYSSVTPKREWSSTATRKPAWSSSATPKLVWYSSVRPKQVWSSSTTSKPVWPSSTIPKPVWSSSATPKPVWRSSTTPQPAWFNIQKTNLFSTRRQSTMSTPIWFNTQKTNLYSSRKRTSVATQKPLWFNNQNISLYFTRKSNLAITPNPLLFDIKKPNIYSIQKQTTATTHKPLWYQTWYQNYLTNTSNNLFRRKKSDNDQ